MALTATPSLADRTSWAMLGPGGVKSEGLGPMRIGVLKSFRAPVRYLLLGAVLALSACGGGGGGGGGGGPPTPTTVFPASLTVTRPENTPGPWDAGAFQVYAPTSDTPTGLALS